MNDRNPPDQPEPRPPHPGEFIREQVLAPRGLSVSAAARTLRVRRHNLGDVIIGKVGLSIMMALRIEMAFGTPMEKLLRMQLACDIAAARARSADIDIKPYRPGKLQPRIGGPGEEFRETPYLPLTARVAIERLAAAYEWAIHSDHPECRFALWSLARIHARALAHGINRAIIMRELSIIASLYDEAESPSGLAPLCPELAAFHCPVTREAVTLAHPAMQVFVYRVLRDRKRIAANPTMEEREQLKSSIARNRTAILKFRDKLDPSPYPIPLFSDLLTPEERVYQPALAWAATQPVNSAAFKLFEKLQSRTDTLAVKERVSPLSRNKDNNSYYIYKSGSLYPWYRQLARLYLASPST